MNTNPMVEAGVLLWHKLLYETSESKDAQGVKWLHGRYCEGNGAYSLCKLNRDAATPYKVLVTIGSTHNTRDAMRVANLHILKKFNIPFEP